jgi:solute carrier family 13 (sodium-dependent dicarboxylate transporter), member 2/3/5
MSLLTIGVSNTMTAGAAVAVLAPSCSGPPASLAGEDPIIFGFVTAISSSFGYLTPAAQPAFTIIYASGYLKGTDFLKIGLRMMVLSMVFLFVMMAVYWPLLGQSTRGRPPPPPRRHRAAPRRQSGCALPPRARCGNSRGRC